MKFKKPDDSPDYTELHSPQFHRNLEEYAAYSNIPVKYITESAAGKVPKGVEKWLIQFPTSGSLTINLNETSWDENEVAFSMAGMLTRNLIAVKVLSMLQLYDLIDLRKVADPTCIILPSFHGSAKVEIPSWKQTMILDALREREMLNKKTVLIIRNKANLAQVFGTGVTEYMQTKFELVTA